MDKASRAADNKMLCKWGMAMKVRLLIVTINALLLGCGDKASVAGNDVVDPNAAKAEEFIDAFYSFDRDKLAALLDHAGSSKVEILYYQGWAEGGNYKIVNRQPCVQVKLNTIACPITVDDDLINVLGIAFDVTDTFALTFSDGEIVSVETSSDDPAEFHAAMEWVKSDRPKLIDVPCKGYYAGGPTPGNCCKAYVQGFKEFASIQRSSK